MPNDPTQPTVLVDKLLSMDWKTFIVVLIISLAALSLIAGINVRVWTFDWEKIRNWNIRSIVAPWREEQEEVDEPRRRIIDPRRRREDKLEITWSER